MSLNGLHNRRKKGLSPQKKSIILLYGLCLLLLLSPIPLSVWGGKKQTLFPNLNQPFKKPKAVFRGRFFDAESSEKLIFRSTFQICVEFKEWSCQFLTWNPRSKLTGQLRCGLAPLTSNFSEHPRLKSTQMVRILVVVPAPIPRGVISDKISAMETPSPAYTHIRPKP